MKLLIICAGDRSNYNIALNAIKHLDKTQDNLTVCVLDKNDKIKKYLKKKKIKFLDKNFEKNKIFKSENASFSIIMPSWIKI